MNDGSAADRRLARDRVSEGGHRHLRDGVVVIEGTDILHVGPQGSWSQPVDETIDARGMVVTPGFINTHTHLYESPLDKSFVEDMGRRQFYLSGLFEYLPVRSMAMDEEAAHACLAYSMAELLRTGTTTVMEIGSYGEEAVRQAGRVGMRLYMGLGYRSGRWYTDDGKRSNTPGMRRWTPRNGGRGPLHRGARRRTERSNQGFLSPSQVDTCTENLLRRSRQAASSMGVPLALHASQSVNEFLEMTRRHGATPIEWLRDIGFLGSDVILGHAIIVAPGSWTNWSGDDVGILADTSTNVAHAVWVFARRGIAMESFARYLARGVNMTLGTDTSPQSMIEGLRYTAVVSKIVDRQTEVATAADVFNAATLAGAKALGRDDLGRIAPGAKADLLLWRSDSIFMTPLRDPIRNIVYSATAEDLDTVLIDGEVRMRGREIPALTWPR